MTLIRYVALGLPLALLVLAARADRSKAGRAGALLSFIGTLIGLAALHVGVCGAAWTYADVDATFRGFPVDLWLGWAILWGPIPVLLRRFISTPFMLGALMLFDAVLMPQMEPLVHLEPGWALYDAAGILVVALPAQLAGRWSADRVHLGPRVVLQMAIFTGLSLWLTPTLAFEFGSGAWPHDFAAIAIAAECAAVASAPALIAVLLFAQAGGTPYPWDPPQYLVTTGPYAYVANPMQCSAVLLLLLASVATRSWALALAAVVGALFSVGVAALHERDTMRELFGQQWVDYRREVHDWLPRLRPHATPQLQATLWLDLHCGTCRGVGDFLLRRKPIGLVIRPAAEHAETLWRARYEGGGGQVQSGVAAVACALEHTHLGWAYIGWVLRLPGIVWLAQLIADALLAPPHPAVANEV